MGSTFSPASDRRAGIHIDLINHITLITFTTLTTPTTPHQTGDDSCRKFPFRSSASD